MGKDRTNLVYGWPTKKRDALIICNWCGNPMIDCKCVEALGNSEYEFPEPVEDEYEAGIRRKFR